MNILSRSCPLYYSIIARLFPLNSKTQWNSQLQCQGIHIIKLQSTRLFCGSVYPSSLNKGFSSELLLGYLNEHTPDEGRRNQMLKR